MTAKKVCETLQNNGFVAVLAGGCVRDEILGRNPKDIDVATNATPDEIENCFEKTVAIGKSFGVINVIMDGEMFDVATFRNDGDYSDSRRPDSVVFTTEMHVDATRRDLTINGLFKDPVSNRIYDFVGGVKDLENRVIRSIGNPNDRILEDNLRMLRVVRFAVVLDFQIDTETFEAVCKHSHKINTVSWERIRDELSKMLLADPVKSIQLLNDTGMLEHILPEVSNLQGCEQSPVFHPEGDAFVHTLKVLKNISIPTVGNRFELVLAALLHDIGKRDTFKIIDGHIRNHGHAELGEAMAEKVCRRMKLTNEARKIICELVGSHMKFHHISKMKKAKLKRLMSRDVFPLMLELHRADCVGGNGDLSNFNFCLEKEREFENEPKASPKARCALINGTDLIVLGFRPGPKFREILDRVEDEYLEGNLSTKDEALDFVRMEF